MSSVFEKLSYLKDTKKAIADAIEECNVTVPENSTFFSFGNLIRQIQGQFNKYHNPPKPTYTQSTNNPGVSTSPVNTSAGEFDADDETQRVTIAVRVTKNTKLIASDPSTWGSDPDVLITDNGGLSSSTDENGNNVVDTSKGIDGFSQVEVAVGFEEPIDLNTYRVQFWSGTPQNKGTLLYTDKEVPALGQAHYGGTTPTAPSGKVFAGWEPGIGFVSKNIDTFPVFLDAPSGTPGEISDSLETICANGGAPYPLGSWKRIDIAEMDNPTTYLYSMKDTQDPTKGAKRIPYSSVSHIPGGTAIIKKVYAGEDGTTSTWRLQEEVWSPTDGSSNHQWGISWNGYLKDTIIFTGLDNGYNGYLPDYAMILDAADGENYPDGGWNVSFLRSFLNGTFLGALPECLQKAIRPVQKFSLCKTSYSTNPGYGSESYALTMDAVWIASYHELTGDGEEPSIVFSTASGLTSSNKEDLQQYLCFRSPIGLWMGDDDPSIYKNSGDNALYSKKFMGMAICFCLSPSGSALNNQESGGENNGSSEQSQETQGN